MSDERWKAIERELKREVRPDPEAVARILTRVHAPAPAGRLARAWRWLTRPRQVMVSPLAGMASAAATVLLVTLPLLMHSAAPLVEPQVAAGVAAAPASGDTLQSVQFVLVAPEAARVSLVGDFNDWDPAATPLRRTTEEGVWSVVVPLQSGRYLYAFVVDGSTWVPDASAPRGPENAFGAPNSVVLVGENT
ncbi:MAG TPA: isoamylase early set domain-containing protein [Longimicrobiaceae bacterium]|nr:isoamylase early set domain-containing protein [Longimicrobiaceae bacterium]